MSLPIPSTIARRRGYALVAVAATGASLLLAPSAASAATAKPTTIAYSGSAYGTTVALGTLVKSGTTALLPMCTTTAPSHKSIHTAAANIPGLGSVGAIDTTVASNKVGAAYSATTTSTTAETALLPLVLGNVITLKAVATTAKAKHTPKGYELTASTTFLGLKIAGVELPSAPVPANTTIPLPGIGSIMLNKQTTANNHGVHAIAVKALSITIGSNLLGLPTGTVNIGYARAALHNAIFGNVSGAAYGTLINLGNGLVKSGPTAPAYLPCGGSSSSLVSNATAAAKVPSVLSVGAVRSSTVSFDHPTSTTAIAANRLAEVNLFNGAVKINALTTRSVVTRNSKGLTRKSTGTLFAGISVNGKAYSNTPKPNTTFSLPGIGTLYLNRQLAGPNGLHVYGLQIVLGTATAGLPVGATITIGAAYAAVLPRG